MRKKEVLIKRLRRQQRLPANFEEEIRALQLNDRTIKEHLTKREYRRWKRLPVRQRKRYVEEAKVSYYLKHRKSTNIRAGHPNGKSFADRPQLKAGSQEMKLKGSVLKDRRAGGNSPSTERTQLKLNLPSMTADKKETAKAAAYVAGKAKALGENQIRNMERREEQERNTVISEMAAEDFRRQMEGAARGAGTAVSLFFPEGKTISTLFVPLILALVIGIFAFATLIVTLIAGIAAETETRGKRIVQVALAEKEAGDQKGGEKYWSWYGFSSRVEWCASFVSWCADQCDYIEQEIFPKSASVNGYRLWYQRRGLYADKTTYIPRAGDLIIFQNGMSHIGIVQYVKGSQVVTIEGNANDRLMECSYPLGYGGISGYCTPEYPQGESDFSGDTNAEIAWNFFRSKGCSEETTAGILGNLQQESGLNPESEQSSGGPGRGIAQWTVNGGRYNNLLKMAEDMGMEWTDIRVQLEFIWWEMKEGETTCIRIMEQRYGGLEGFMYLMNVRKACDAFEACYERAGKPMMEKRYKYAEAFYEQYAGN